MNTLAIFYWIVLLLTALSGVWSGWRPPYDWPLAGRNLLVLLLFILIGLAVFPFSATTSGGPVRRSSVPNQFPFSSGQLLQSVDR
jgi:hypothetical protein